MTEIVTADIGGTYARFALATVADGRVVSLGEPVTLHTASHTSLRLAWEAFAGHVGRPLPRGAAIAVAGPVTGERVTLTHSGWTIERSRIAADLALDAVTLVNDFGAVGWAVDTLDPGDFVYLCGPDQALPATGVITVIGPGTGLGVAYLVRQTGRATVVETEGGHIGFTPEDATDDAILAHLRRRHGRVSAERVVSGTGFTALHGILADIADVAAPERTNRDLWTAALTGADDLASTALDRFCLSLGSVAGDLALAQGASGVVIAGGLGLRLADHLPRSGFARRFTTKGRFEAMMAAIPVKLITHPQPGLYGAAAAFAQEHDA